MSDLLRPWHASYGPGVPAVVDLPDEPVTSSLARAAAAWPQRVAVDFLGATTTYAGLADEVARGAQALVDLGVGSGDRVAIALPNCAAHVVAFHAALRIGAVVVEHNPTYTARELAHQLADSGAVVAIVWEKAVEAVLQVQAETAVRTVVAVDLSADLPRRSRLALRLPVPAARRTREALRGPVPAGTPSWHRLVARTAPLDDAYPLPDAADLALIQYTGGTTGTPKGAMITHANLVANAVQGQAWTGAEEGTETIYGVLPFFHAFGLTLCLTYASRIGATLVVFPKFDPEQVLAAQRRRPGTFLPAVPPMLDRLAAAAETSGTDLTSFRYAISGAMPLPAATAQRWERLTGGYVVEGYGLTETSPVALGSPLSPARRPGALGLPFPSTDIRIVDPEDTTREVDEGELLIHGPQVFAGYWHRREETAEQLLEGGWLRTGDIVRMDDDGMVVLVDRIKEMIVTGGFKVYPSQVEDQLRAMPGVLDVAVIGVPAGDLGEHVVAAVTLSPGASVDLASVRAWLAPRVAKYAVPRDLVVLDELPRSLIGKVLRRVVREDYLAR
ncbi:AMP-binding protein [Cellulomonas rhizosphaerae]|uniref:Long-chain fatty acid--CoA ligase n=1 Tax=Cellulomonas rhizosphaerae TaxID=2293719 RepID=A0A413RJW4_9CELL|nr:AMP-binding protein [Cellulomonas rhizosphaerae]RHA38984.1 long-chain fatty acid--CoA ligase [Cellulomonas rhizosphaerae]